MTDREQIRRDARNAAQLFEAGELIAAAHKEATACDRDGYDVTARIIRDLAARAEQAERREKRVRHILEDIADPYNERRGQLKVWANEALDIIKDRP